MLSLAPRCSDIWRYKEAVGVTERLLGEAFCSVISFMANNLSTDVLWERWGL